MTGLFFNRQAVRDVNRTYSAMERLYQLIWSNDADGIDSWFVQFPSLSVADFSLCAVRPLSASVMFNSLQACDALLAHGLDPDARDSVGPWDVYGDRAWEQDLDFAPLHHAAEMNDPRFLELLRRARACMTAELNGETPVEILSSTMAKCAADGVLAPGERRTPAILPVRQSAPDLYGMAQWLSADGGYWDVPYNCRIGDFRRSFEILFVSGGRMTDLAREDLAQVGNAAPGFADEIAQAARRYRRLRLVE